MGQDAEGTSISLRAVATAVSAVGVIIGAAFAIDSRYASAQEVKQYKGEVATQIQHQTVELQRQTAILRKQTIEDKLFELDVKREQNSGLSPVDSAVYKRYDRQLQDVNQQLGSK